MTIRVTIYVVIMILFMYPMFNYFMELLNG